LLHAAGQRQGGHLEVGVVGDAAVLAFQGGRRGAQLRQLAADSPQVLGVVAALKARLGGSDVVVDGAVNVDQFFVVLDFLGVFQETPHHPGMGQDDVQAFDGGGGRHGQLAGRK
jgi:hypothetical protein